MSDLHARCFVALELPAAARDALERLVERLRATDAQVRWARRDAMHLTLKFLGEVPRGRLDELARVLATVRLDAPLQLRLAGAGRFPPRGRPRVFWVGLAGDTDRLVELAARVDAACAELGFARETRPLHAHVTLARVKGPRGLDQLEHELARRGEALDVPLGAQRELTLFESELAPSGSRYTERARARFVT